LLAREFVYCTLNQKIACGIAGFIDAGARGFKVLQRFGAKPLGALEVGGGRHKPHANRDIKARTTIPA
jgi:hypothetical protein